MRPVHIVAFLLVECLVQIVESSERGRPLPTSSSDLLEMSRRTGIPAFPSPGQRCTGRAVARSVGQRCCTPQDPCGEGEGDCDGPLDGAAVHDGHRGCKVNRIKTAREKR